MATADQIARYLAQIQAGGTSTVPAPAVRKARAQAQRIADAAHALDFGAVAALLDAAPPDAATVTLLVHIATLNGAASHQRKTAQAKNAKARAYVLAEWSARATVNEGKAEWSRRYVGIVFREFKTRIKAETISRDWLPKSNGLSEDQPKDSIAWTGKFYVPRKT